MKYKILGAITIIGLSSSPVVAMETNKLTMSKDNLIQTDSITEILPIIEYSGENDDKILNDKNNVFIKESDILIPTVPPQTAQ